MKSILATCFLSCIICVCSWGQSQQKARGFSFAVLNGISNQHFLRVEGDESKLAYVNAFRFQIELETSPKHSSIIGLQYGKNGASTIWICEETWDYCSTIGVPPIEVRSTERKHYLSFFYHSRYTLSTKYYLQGGLALDFPIRNTFHNKYVSSNGDKSRDKDADLYGRQILINTTIGANLIVGKKIQLNEKWQLFLEMEYKMYHLITFRFEDYEDYFFKKNQKPWGLGFNMGITINHYKE